MLPAKMWSLLTTSFGYDQADKIVCIINLKMQLNTNAFSLLPALFPPFPVYLQENLNLYQFLSHPEKRNI